MLRWSRLFLAIVLLLAVFVSILGCKSQPTSLK